MPSSKVKMKLIFQVFPNFQGLEEDKKLCIVSVDYSSHVGYI